MKILFAFVLIFSIGLIVWGTIYNQFGVVLVGIILILLYNIAQTNYVKKKIRGY
jgi:hypothetical protein